MAERICAVCGTALVRRSDEPKRIFLKRPTCSKSCGAKFTWRYRERGVAYKVEEAGYDTPCWMWQRGKTTAGYGRTEGDYAHRLYYEQEHGPIPEGLFIHHLCRNKACVNPAHLETVSNAENVRRGIGTKLTAQDAREIRASPMGCRRLAAAYGVHRTTIMQIRRGNTWRDVA